MAGGGEKKSTSIIIQSTIQIKYNLFHFSEVCRVVNYTGSRAK